MMVVLLCIAVTLCEPLHATSDMFSVNFYAYGGLESADNEALTRLNNV